MNLPSSSSDRLGRRGSCCLRRTVIRGGLHEVSKSASDSSALMTNEGDFATPSFGSRNDFSLGDLASASSRVSLAVMRHRVRGRKWLVSGLYTSVLDLDNLVRANQFIQSRKNFFESSKIWGYQPCQGRRLSRPNLATLATSPGIGLKSKPADPGLHLAIALTDLELIGMRPLAPQNCWMTYSCLESFRC